ncbi:MAG: hypothetical protein KDD56_04655, partial [Bdellovibrionales bacterium]|nr:hypothetical protein [Bdellovibrionales bacterium]
RLRAANHKTLATVLLIVAIGFPAYRSYQFSSEIVNDTRRQMEVWMLNNLPRGSKIYLDWRRYAPEFWNNEFEITYIQRAKIMPKLDIRSLKSSGQEYLVLSSLFYDRYFSQPKSDAAVRQRLREVFERVPIVKEINPEYGTYGFHNPVLTLFSLKKEDFENLEAELAEKKAGKIQETSNDKKTTFPWFVE